MEKLIELLNEYDNEEFGEALYMENKVYANDFLIISKKFGFIQWLVDNDKIDISKLGKKSDMGFGDKYTREESLLMLLAISKNPIKELISYLK